jgi:hypothetical protein
MKGHKGRAGDARRDALPMRYLDDSALMVDGSMTAALAPLSLLQLRTRYSAIKPMINKIAPA